MNNEPPQSNETERENKGTSSGLGLLLALLLGFAPAAMVLALLRLKPNLPPRLFWVPCALSVACCFSSSFLLFARRTVLAILAGVLFLILNALIACFFGCSAYLNGGF
jgi:hypothetical protein